MIRLRVNLDPDRMDLRLADARCMDENGQKNPGAALNRNKSTQVQRQTGQNRPKG